METDHDKIIRLEEKSDALSKVVYEIKDNHLAHLAVDVKDLKKAIEAIDRKIAMWSGAIGLAIWLADKFF